MIFDEGKAQIVLVHNNIKYSKIEIDFDASVQCAQKMLLAIYSVQWPIKLQHYQ